MKKIISLLLALTCVFALFACDDEEKKPCTVHVDSDNNGLCDSCGATVEKTPCETHTDANLDGVCDVCEAEVEVPKTPLESFVEIVNSSVPTEIITNTTYNVKADVDPFKGTFETTVYEDGYKLSYSYQNFADPTAPGADPDKFVMDHEGCVYYHEGLYSYDLVDWFAAAPNATTLQVKLSLVEENLDKDYYEISRDGKTFTANVTAEQAEAILGIEISCDGDGVDITITHDGANLRSISVSYATKNAEIVTLDTSYSYNDVVSPFGAENG